MSSIFDPSDTSSMIVSSSPTNTRMVKIFSLLSWGLILLVIILLIVFLVDNSNKTKDTNDGDDTGDGEGGSGESGEGGGGESGEGGSGGDGDGDGEPPEVSTPTDYATVTYTNGNQFFLNPIIVSEAAQDPDSYVGLIPFGSVTIPTDNEAPLTFNGVPILKWDKVNSNFTYNNTVQALYLVDNVLKFYPYDPNLENVRVLFDGNEMKLNTDVLLGYIETTNIENVSFQKIGTPIDGAGFTLSISFQTDRPDPTPVPAEFFKVELRDYNTNGLLNQRVPLDNTDIELVNTGFGLDFNTSTSKVIVSGEPFEMFQRRNESGALVVRYASRTDGYSSIGGDSLLTLVNNSNGSYSLKTTDTDEFIEAQDITNPFPLKIGRGALNPLVLFPEDEFGNEQIATLESDQYILQPMIIKTDENGTVLTDPIFYIALVKTSVDYLEQTGAVPVDWREDTSTFLFDKGDGLKEYFMYFEDNTESKWGPLADKDTILGSTSRQILIEDGGLEIQLDDAGTSPVTLFAQQGLTFASSQVTNPDYFYYLTSDDNQTSLSFN